MKTNVTKGEWEAVININYARYPNNRPKTLVCSNGKQVANCYIPKEESNIDLEQSEANAAYICLAVNNFDKLVECAKRLIEQYELAVKETLIGITDSDAIFKELKTVSGNALADTLNLLQSIEQIND